jgi:hypothetical protein
VKVSTEKSQSIPQSPMVPDNGPSQDDSPDFGKLSVASHACQLAIPIALCAPILPISKLTLLTLPPYQEPRLPHLQRPPSV